MRLLVSLIVVVLAGCSPAPEVSPIVYRVATGGHVTGYLIGTIHQGVGLSSRAMARIEAFLRDAEALAVERDFADAMFAPRFEKAIATSLTGRSWSDIAGTDGLAAVESLGRKAGATALDTTPAQFHPMLLVGAAMRQCDPAVLRSAVSMDGQIQDAARRTGKRIEALETPEEMAAPLAAMPTAIWRAYLTQADQFISPSCKEPVARHVEDSIAAYAKHDAAGVRTASLRMHQVSGLADVHGAAIFGREPGLSQRVVKQFASARRTVVVMIGAAHLAGPDGAIAQLRAAGLRVEPVGENAKER